MSETIILAEYKSLYIEIFLNSIDIYEILDTCIINAMYYPFHEFKKIYSLNDKKLKIDCELKDKLYDIEIKFKELKKYKTISIDEFEKSLNNKIFKSYDIIITNIYNVLQYIQKYLDSYLVKFDEKNWSLAIDNIEEYIINKTIYTKSINNDFTLYVLEKFNVKI